MVRALYGSNTDLMEVSYKLDELRPQLSCFCNFCVSPLHLLYLQRESMGQITADADSVFAESLIDSWMQLKAWTLTQTFSLWRLTHQGEEPA